MGPKCDNCYGSLFKKLPFNLSPNEEFVLSNFEKTYNCDRNDIVHIRGLDFQCHRAFHVFCVIPIYRQFFVKRGQAGVLQEIPCPVYNCNARMVGPTDLVVTPFEEYYSLFSASDPRLDGLISGKCFL